MRSAVQGRSSSRGWRRSWASARRSSGARSRRPGRPRGDAMQLDGAVGTELARHGFVLRGPRWSAAAIDDAPALLEGIHRAYVDAGAEIVTAATTCAHPYYV